MDVTTLSVEVLKSLAYDQIMVIEQAQQNLAILQQELAKRAVAENKTDPTEEARRGDVKE